jgi:isopentenyl diphosphate isomerase/L-lactate dehydrogenase-like FMN-dependent dehydrogenase
MSRPPSKPQPVPAREPPPVSIPDYQRLAEERCEPGPWAYLMGAAGDEWTMRENRAAFERWTFRPRVLCDVADVRTATTVLGKRIAMPLLVAPVAYQQLFDADAEAATARAAAAAEIPMCVSTFTSRPHETIAAMAPGVVQWCQLYVFRDLGLTREHIHAAVGAGCRAIVLTVDTPRLGRRERDLRAGFLIPPELPLPYARPAIGNAPQNPAEQFELLSPSVTWRDLEWIATTSGLPIVLKGIVTAEDAALAVEYGAAAVVVSNHGGRQLEGAPATLDALPEVVEQVAGRAEVYLDGGVRRGGDVAKALALGARAVLAGRAPMFGLAARGEAGVRHVLELLRDEFSMTLGFLGCTAPDQLGRAHVQRAAS